MSARAYEIALLRSQLEGAAEEMGRLLARSAFSPNIRERLDFSCALFDADGQLLAQAAHIPVHLGSLPDLLMVISAQPQRRGDCWIANSPYHGGTHLPDLTLVTPVFRERRLIGFAAARAHHSDVGGMTAGSMPDSAEVYQEGLILPPVRLLTAGRHSELWQVLLANVRTPVEREGDLRAQLAACRLGGRRLAQLDLKLVPQLLDASEAQMEQLLSPLGEARGEAREEMDWGRQRLPLEVRLTLAGGSACIDLRAAGPALAAPINATRAITCAAAYFPFFCLARARQGKVVINAGSLRRLTVLTEPGTWLHAVPPFPVCAGNVETSQRISDLILRALAPLFPEEIPAQSACTMNNLTIGNAHARPPFSYYETCGGGHGASPRGRGASGQQIAMTNTRNTPAEILEAYYPLRLWSYRLRPESGGAGRHPGGQGVTRELELLHEAQVSLLATRRTLPAQGLAGGGAGALGCDRVDGKPVATPYSGWLPAGARLMVETPGGGGWGPVA